MPANFKTYESQARLVAAIVAAHPELRLNYKAIAAHYGKSQTVSAMEHRFRPVRHQAEAIRQMVEQKIDPESVNILDMPKNDIAKFFGESTPDGIQFHFRSVKVNADKLKSAVETGGDPVASFGQVNLPTTPGSRKRARAPAAAPKSNIVKKMTPGSVSRRNTPKKNYREPTDKDEDSESFDYEGLDEDTPTKKRMKEMPMKITTAQSRDEILAERRAKAKEAANNTVQASFSSAVNRSGTVTATSVGSPSDIEILTPDAVAEYQQQRHYRAPVSAVHEAITNLKKEANQQSSMENIAPYVGGNNPFNGIDITGQSAHSLFGGDMDDFDCI
ncbi:hypothetical protein B0T26DRAFT_672731 [Lasiosphaeria miniovina]|uniref:Uncharacterized protein n=1 Tax=Lasiosphaeria miniovina TaxID=1954250 RepID=A0AA40E5S9_9PEZI|nr:uncharacterized protein B0T26DRAFT_672731 [Lasiosphaeria miniovina]KAK0728150.1 hypothetical protein B0T26DRAFT_672731 [Lasiosphaeria miniovina]